MSAQETKRGWIAVYIIKQLDGTERRRYIEDPGFLIRRGMYSQRKVVGRVKPRLGDDIERAYLFRSRAEAEHKLQQHWGRALVRRSIQFEKIGGRAVAS